MNTPEAITSMRFFQGRGAPSVYHLTKEEFTNMMIGHLTARTDFETGLSSWAASLRFLLYKLVFWLACSAPVNPAFNTISRWSICCGHWSTIDTERAHEVVIARWEQQEDNDGELQNSIWKCVRR